MEDIDYLKYELNRLSRLNNELEKRINKGYKNDEHELIIKNTLAMCEIAKILF